MSPKKMIPSLCCAICSGLTVAASQDAVTVNHVPALQRAPQRAQSRADRAPPPHQKQARAARRQGRRHQPTTAQRRGAHMRRGAENRARAATTNDTKKRRRARNCGGGGAARTRPGENRRRDRLIDMIKRAAYSSSSISHGFHCPAYMSATYSTHACSISAAVIVHPSGMHPWAAPWHLLQSVMRLSGSLFPPLPRGMT